MATTPPTEPTPTPIPGTTPPPSASGGMVDRIKNILLSPKTEWPRIDAEPMTEQGIFTGWVLPLAAIGPVASFIGGQVFGYGAFGIVFKPPLMMALVSAVLGYVLAVAGIWVLAKIVDALAPSFGGVKNPVSALKVVAFSYTASFVGGIFGIVPMLGFLGILFALYGLYLLYLGLPVLMKAPQDKAIGYTVVSVLCAIVLYFVIAMTVGALSATFVGASMMTPTTVGGTVNVPGGGSVDLAKLDAAAKKMEATAKAMEAGAAGGTAGAAAVKPIDPNALQALLPATAAGWNRTTVESASAGAAGVAGSNAKGDYSRGSDTAQLSVTDMGAMGALTALGSAFNVQANRTTETGFEKTGQVDGRMTTEKWDGGSRRGEYSTVVANRFVVSVEGEADSLDTLKALAATVNIGTLEGMAR